MDCENVIWCKNANMHFSYSENGTERGWLNGLQILKPSEHMQDWDKFAWKQGDVLVDSDGTYAMFDGWSEDDFSEFNTKYSATPLGYGKFCVDEDRIFNTLDFDKVEDKKKDDFIEILEKEYNGKFNPETLEIEGLQKKCEFKPFDKVLVRDTKDECWRPAFFASFDEHCINEYAYGLIGDPEGVFCKYCIPYNDHTAHLLGTNNDCGGSEE